ncbi:hypothetical protein [Desulfovibrio inopinatus]|nr:hypothetical protein [Desulfovibrio inopinatus]
MDTLLVFIGKNDLQNILHMTIAGFVNIFSLHWEDVTINIGAGDVVLS